MNPIAEGTVKVLDNACHDLLELAQNCISLPFREATAEELSGNASLRSVSNNADILEL